MLKLLDVNNIPAYRLLGEPKKNNRKITDHYCKGDLRGSDCFIIGGGQSVSNYDLNDLRDQFTIGLNRSALSMPFEPTIMFFVDARIMNYVYDGVFCDSEIALFKDITPEKENALDPVQRERLRVYRYGGTFTKEERERFENFKGLIIRQAVDNIGLPEDIYIIDHNPETQWLEQGKSKHKFSKDLSKGVGTGGSTGFAALNFARLLGFDNIYLLGYDYYGDPEGRVKNWHGGYDPNETNKNAAKPTYEDAMLPHFDNLDRDDCHGIMNLNLKSKLTRFPLANCYDKREKTKIISFYTTPSKLYESAARRLLFSVRRLGINHFIVPIEQELFDREYEEQPIGVSKIPTPPYIKTSDETWKSACNFKTKFIFHTLLANLENPDRQPLAWVDADAVINRYPEDFDKFKDQGFDVVVNRIPKERYGVEHEIAGGTVWFSGNDASIAFAEEWNKESQNNHEWADLDALRITYYRMKDKINIGYMKRSYCYVYDLDIHNQTDDPIIEHFQASRKARQGLHDHPIVDSMGN